MWKYNDFVWRRRSVNILKLNELASICAVGGACWRKFIAFSAAPWPNAALMFYFGPPTLIFTPLFQVVVFLSETALAAEALWRGAAREGASDRFISFMSGWREDIRWLGLAFWVKGVKQVSRKKPTPFSWCNQSLPLGLVLIRGSREEHIPTRCQRAGCVNSTVESLRVSQGGAWRGVAPFWQ